MPTATAPDLVTIDARAGSLSICLRNADPGWCRVQLIATGDVVVLGSDDLIGLAVGLGALLADDLAGVPGIASDGSGLYEGRVLADTRVRVCAAEVAGMREVVFARQGAVLERVALDRSQRVRWRSELSRAHGRRHGRPRALRAARWPRRATRRREP